MPDFAIHVSLDVNAVQRIWITLDGVAFPDAAWTDFPVVILAWWADTTESLMRDPRGKALWHFMEGPFRVELDRFPGDTSAFYASRHPVISRSTRDGLKPA